MVTVPMRSRVLTALLPRARGISRHLPSAAGVSPKLSQALSPLRPSGAALLWLPREYLNHQIRAEWSLRLPGMGTGLAKVCLRA